MKNEMNLSGKDYWRSLDQLAETDQFKDFLHREFPEDAAEMTSSVSRRKFLTLMGASIAFAGLAGCRKPVEKIVPYVNAPENIIPGIPHRYATTMPFGLNSYGLVVESHEGRPTKIEGNEKHPSSLGKSNAQIQASVLGLYDPDRSQGVLKENKDSDWDAFVGYWREQHKAYSENGGEGLAVLSDSFASPTLYRLYGEFRKNFPKAKWYAYEPVSDENIFKGLELATGKSLRPIYHFDKAQVVLALDSDFLLTESESITANKGFAAGRKMETEKDSMNRLYVVENNFTVTGGMADHRLRLQTRQIAAFAVALAKEFENQGLAVDYPLDRVSSDISEFDPKWIREVVKDLLVNRAKSLVVAGQKQPAILHALVYALNAALENNSVSVAYYEFADSVRPSVDDLVRLNSDIREDRVETLIMMNTNPVYSAPADLDFKRSLKKVKNKIHVGTDLSESAFAADWHLPFSHYLEGWGDVRSADGSMSVIQPMIEPLFGTRALPELLELFVSGKEKSAYEITRQTWQAKIKGDFDPAWRKILHDGIMENSHLSMVKSSMKSADVSAALKENPFPTGKADSGSMEIVFQVSPAVYDGRFANNGWLQEMPDPVTKLAWDNAALISPVSAKALALKNEDLVVLKYNNRKLRLPVWIQPGHADNSITVYLGYGRSVAGRIGTGVGANACQLRSAGNPQFDRGLQIDKTGEVYPLANTQDHGSMEGRPLVREADLSTYREQPNFAPDMVKHPPLKSLWEEPSYDEGYQWGMTIDLNACSGCNACVVACQSENNIPVIGKEQVAKGREMHWIRLDRYYAGDLNNPEMVYQPVACQHCENAPCEQVCPVVATSHDEEGLNLMTYNRCIGTRYCSNNCPYKVRRFNFFNYTNELPELMKMAQNPDVSVRSRGVMEKCTFCTQRINEKKILAKNEERTVGDGEIQTACQQSCPADAIVFGNINDPESAVSKMKQQNRDYTMLGELNLKTRTTYLAKLRNPNPALIDLEKEV